MLVLLVILALITSGCSANRSEKNNNVTPAANHQAPKPLDANDLNITYNGILINDGIPFSRITDKLGFGIGYQENNYGLISQNNGVRRFALNYSSGEGIDIRLVFVESKDTIFAFADLIKIPTSRGIKVGDSIDKLYEMYGESDISASGEVIYEIGEKRLIFETDKNNGIIKKITIDYNMKLADKEQGL
jgi:hypothetical protein